MRHFGSSVHGVFFSRNLNLKWIVAPGESDTGHGLTRALPRCMDERKVCPVSLCKCGNVNVGQSLGNSLPSRLRFEGVALGSGYGPGGSLRGICCRVGTRRRFDKNYERLGT